MSYVRAIGVKPDLIDDRDLLYTNRGLDLPVKISLRQYASDSENQLNTNSCATSAIVSAIELMCKKDGISIELSKAFLCYNLKNTHIELHSKDNGSYLRDGFAVACKFGICLEDTWKFNLATINTRPSKVAFAEAKTMRIKSYRRIEGFFEIGKAHMNALVGIKNALYDGYPVVIGMTLDETFHKLGGKDDLTTHSYINTELSPINNHAMCIVGYDDKLDGFIVENSWGSDWGDGGFCLISYDVIRSDVHDAWICDGIITEETKPVFMTREYIAYYWCKMITKIKKYI